MEVGKKKTVPFKVKLPNLESLRTLSNKLTSLSRGSFVTKYGNILDLLFTDVQAGAITALFQFYDPPMRSFLFKDFQLAPTLEEYERLVGVPSENKGPFVEINQFPNMKKLAGALGIDVLDLEKNFKTRTGGRGFSSAYLEKKANELSALPDKKAFVSILALLIYGLVLFPTFEDFVDAPAISVFWAVFEGDRNPVPALLADTYYGLHTRYGKVKGNLECCLPLLYQWISSLLPGHHMQWNKLDSHGWTQLMANLHGSSIRWHSLKVDQEVIISCGEFPNVPLIGPKACISYNPILSMRQLGRIMLDKPEDSSLESMLLPGSEAKDSILLKKILQAWEKVRTVNRLKRKEIRDGETYSQWVTRRVQEVKLPFILKDPIVQPAPEPAPISLEEVEGLHKTITDLKGRKEELANALLTVIQERSNLERQVKEKDQTVEDLKDQLAAMEEKKIRFEEALFSAGCDLQQRNEWVRDLKREVEKLKGSDFEVARLEAKIEEERSYVKARFLQKVKEFERKLAEEKKKWDEQEKGLRKVVQLTKERCDREKIGSNRRLEQEQARVRMLELSLAQERARVAELEGDLASVRRQRDHFEYEGTCWMDGFHAMASETSKGDYYQSLKQKNDELIREVEAQKSKYSAMASIGNRIIQRFCDKAQGIAQSDIPWETPEDVQRLLDYCFVQIYKFKNALRGDD